MNKNNIKKAWVWFKNYWYVPVLIVGLIILLIFSRSSSAIGNILDLIRKSRERQEEEIRKIEEETKEKKEKEEQRYSEIMEKIEKEYEEQSKELDHKTKLRVKKFVEKTSDEEMAERFAKEFGIEIG